MKKISILHISDLHKRPGTDYDSLFESLLNDRVLLQREGIRLPDYVVVSGDLIQGSTDQKETEGRYRDVRRFFDLLASDYLGGHKERILIVPGNHDVSRDASMRSMERQAEADYTINLKDFRNGDPLLRWNWYDHSFYRITRPDIYLGRLNAFVQFYNDFYEGGRTYPKAAFSGADCVAFPKDGITFTLFNSCNGLDHLNTAGDIDERAISGVAHKLRSSYNSGLLNIAVWHHHFYGSPLQSNYLSRDRIQAMANSFVRLGLFGHQHLSQVAEFVDGNLAFEDAAHQDRILLVSSGTLFGGDKQLPAGCRRQYNVIELTLENGYADVKINVREDDNTNLDSKQPHWVIRRMNRAGYIATTVNFKKQTPEEEYLQLMRYVSASGDYEYGYEQAPRLQISEKERTQLQQQYFRQIKDNRYILDHLRPVTANDYIRYISCALAEDDTDIIRRLLTDDQLKSLQDDPVLSEMTDELADRLQNR